MEVAGMSEPITNKTKEINERLVFVKDFLDLLRETRVFGPLLNQALEETKVAMGQVARLGHTKEAEATRQECIRNN